MNLNDDSTKLILDFEVGGGEAYYSSRLQSPVWPGGESGVTIGVGYDLGYNASGTIAADWAPHLGAAATGRLQQCAGVKGTPAKALVPRVRDIAVPWNAAFAVYRSVTIPRYWRMTCNAFPGVEALHANCQGALLSLVFNRGTSLSGDRRAEMRAIRELVPLQDYAGIAEQIREMKRLWIGTAIETGMARRREAEARLVLRSGGS